MKSFFSILKFEAFTCPVCLDEVTTGGDDRGVEDAVHAPDPRPVHSAVAGDAHAQLMPHVQAPATHGGAARQRWARWRCGQWQCARRRHGKRRQEALVLMAF